MPETFPVRGRDDAAIAHALAEASLALTVDEIKRIAERLGRDPTIVEAYAFDAQWSEHCSYKSSRAFLSRLPTEGPNVLLGVGEDAGIVKLGDWNGHTYGIVIAHESHNHPSQVVPFEGAATGIGGIVRDVLCMGAEVIGLADPLRFGAYDDPHARYVMQGVVDGIAAYGNAIGVPTIAGDVAFDRRFDDNVLVNVVAMGLVRADQIIHSAVPPDATGWDLVLVGKATDRSGFGGAAFSSLSLDEDDAEQNKGAVQVPDPFLKSVIMRASYAVFDLLRAEGRTVGFKDLGAGGVMGCSAELVSSGGYGAQIDLERVSTAQDDLAPAVIAIGETQERLLWALPPDLTERVIAIYNETFALPMIARGAGAFRIGTVTSEKQYVLRHRGETVMDVPIDFLTGGIRYERPFDTSARPRRTVARLDRFGDWLGRFERILAHRDVCSRAPVYERYDSVVRGATAVPAGYGDAGVLAPIPDAPLGVALAVAGNPRYGAIDAKRAGEFAVCEAAMRVAAVGATPVALTDCLNFGNPENPAHLGELVSAIDGLAKAARAFGLPFISGNVSLYNESANGNAVPASPIVACIGTLPDVGRTALRRFTRPGSSIRIVGARGDAFAGSVLSAVEDVEEVALPEIDYALLWRQLDFVVAAIRAGIVGGVHVISDGGALTAVVKMAFATLDDEPIGVAMNDYLAWNADADSTTTAGAFFSEAPGWVLEVLDDAAFDALARAHNVGSVGAAGTTVAGAVLREAGGRDLDLFALAERWRAPLRDLYSPADAEAEPVHP